MQKAKRPEEMTLKVHRKVNGQFEICSVSEQEYRKRIRAGWWAGEPEQPEQPEQPRRGRPRKVKPDADQA